MSGVPFVRSETQVFCENIRNGSWCQIHLLGTNFLFMTRVLSDLSVYHIQHIFCASGTSQPTQGQSRTFPVSSKNF